MPRPLAFISYRRADTRDWSKNLYEAICHAFGADAAFMDVDSIRIGDDWPARIETAAAEATVVLAVIGKQWLFVQDHAGRRRIDNRDDWVFKELAKSLEQNKPLITVLVDGMTMPSPTDFPPAIARLSSLQVAPVSAKEHIDKLVGELETRFGFRRINRALDFPPQVDTSPELTEEQLKVELADLPNWDLAPRALPRAKDGVSKELTRIYKFRSYQDAIHFIVTSSRFIARTQHHPVWENQYKDLRVNITTWDIGNRISHKDVRLARYLENLFREYAVK